MGLQEDTNTHSPYCWNIEFTVSYRLGSLVVKALQHKGVLGSNPGPVVFCTLIRISFLIFERKEKSRTM